MYPLRSYLRNGFFILLFLAVVGYALYQALPYLSGPIITIESPIDGKTYTESRIEVTGQTKNVRLLTVNGDEVALDEHGVFHTIILLSAGINPITFHTEDSFKHTKEQIITVLYIAQ